MLPEPDLSPTQCLDALESNLKTVLLHTGSALGHTTNFDATNITLTKDRVRKTLPPALDKFHRALGDLELELIRARSVLHRDLAASRQQLARNQAYSATSESENASRTSPVARETDSVMVEAPHSAILSHVFGPPSPQQPNGGLANASGSPPDLIHPPADDPLAHSKPSEQSMQAAASARLPNNAESQQGQETAKGANGNKIIETEASEFPDVEVDGIQVTSSGTDVPNSQHNNEASQANNQNQHPLQTQYSGLASNLANQDAGAHLSDLELYENVGSNTKGNDDNFNIEDFTSSHAFNITSASANPDNGEQSQNQEFSTDLPADFLQDGTGDGNSFEEQFDFSTFDFGAGGEEVGGDANGEAQNWDSNFFDESLFNLDDGTGD